MPSGRTDPAAFSLFDIVVFTLAALDENVNRPGKDDRSFEDDFPEDSDGVRGSFVILFSITQFMSVVSVAGFLSDCREKLVLRLTADLKAANIVGR